MLDLPQLTGKQRQFVQLLQKQQRVESLRSLCIQHGFDINFINGFLRSGVLDGYVQWQEHTQQAWVLTPKGDELEGQLPGFALAERLLQGVTDRAQLQAELGSAFSLNYGALRREQAVDMADGTNEGIVVVLKSAVLAAYQQRQAALTAIAKGNPAEPLATASMDWLQQQGYVTRRIESDYS
ncbi:MAG: phenylalanyl--tRNA ligase subunit alpha, partial [Leptolyngbyaceae cyanobacterium SM2_5_2]|nr:phenylalanyl--tRNA ligase subunit alpha [Leptolyngbyaceae cyanobacterium SM2_5_2]